MNDQNIKSSSQIPDTAPNLAGYPYRLMTPGPVPVHPEVLSILAEQPIHHRTPAFEKILARCFANLKKVFQTQQPVIILNSTGTGAMEAALINTLNPGDRVLAVEAGKFGQRWGQMAEIFGAKVDAVAIPWGMAVSAEQIRKELQFGDVKAVLVQACETSTGVYQPIQEIAKVVREFPETLLIVDGITAVGAMPIAMDAWGIDVLIAGSQKAFMLPTGMSFITLSEKAWAVQKQNKQAKYYLDLLAEKEANEKMQTNFSSSVSLIRALDVALQVMLRDGLSTHLRRLDNLAQATRAGVAVYGLDPFPNPPATSLSVFKIPDEIPAGKLRQHLEDKYNVTLMAGQDHLKDKIIRIGHMGYITDDDAIETVRLLGLALRDFQPLMFGSSMPDQAAEACARYLRNNSASSAREELL